MGKTRKGDSTSKAGGSVPSKGQKRNDPYRRILLKISGEALSGNLGYGIDTDVLVGLAKEIQEIHARGVQVGVVLGGGNIFRGIQGAIAGMDRSTADYMGMLATVLNCLALQDALEAIQVPTRVQSAIEMRALAESYIRRKAIRHLEKGRVVIFAAGSGNPYFTTDTTAALRANEIDAQVLLKATKVDGVYDSDPKKNPKAKRFSKVSYIDVLKKGLKVMDSTAISLCMDNRLPIIVFDMHEVGALKRAVAGESVGTLVQ